MTKLTSCRVYEVPAKLETHIAIKNDLRAAIALRGQIQLENGRADISQFRLNNRVRARYLVITTDLPFTRLKRHLQNHFHNYETIELEEGRNCVIKNAFGQRSEIHLEDLIATLNEPRRAIGA